MADSSVEAQMYTIFQLVNDWLKYAEAKNLALVALSGAACSALASYLASAQGLTTDWRKILLTSICVFAISCVMALLSFAPRTRKEYLLALRPDWGKPRDDDNLYFYRHLGKYQAEELAKKYRELFQPTANKDTTSPAPSSAQKQLAEQIIINSRIVVYKLRFFTIALLLAVSAVMIIIVALIYRSVIA